MPTPAALTVLRVLGGFALAVLVALGVVVWLGTGAEAFVAPPAWLVGVQVAAGVVVHLVLDRVGYRSAGDPEGLAPAFQSQAIVRMAFAETVAIVSVAAAFAERSVGWYAGGGAVSAVLILVHVWPWSRPLRRWRVAHQRAGPIREL